MSNIRISFLICILSVLLGYKPAIGAVSQRRAATWNLQGSSASTEAKWTNNVRRIITGTHASSVLALQEAGTPPATAQRQADLGHRLIDPQDLHQHVFEFKWNLGTTRRPDIRWIYYTQNDHGANRVNLAIVTKDRPDHVIILRPPGSYDSVRPILGVQFGKDNYFTIHASASGGGDAAGIVNIIANYFGSRQEYDHQFMIMGDFNRKPQDLRTSLNRQHPDILRHIGIYSTTVATHNSGRILDYAVIAMVGILDGSIVIWVMFFIGYAALIVLLSLKIYYFSFVMTGVKQLYSTYQEMGICKETFLPIRRLRFLLLCLSNSANFAILGVGIYIYINNLTDFGTFLLELLLSNTVLHVTFYTAMKLIHHEKISPESLFFGFLGLGFGIASVIFFLDAATLWTVTPVESRQWNQGCIWFGFYDKHDVWHLLSAPALYFNFLYLMYLDDDLCNKPQNLIPVF